MNAIFACVLCVLIVGCAAESQSVQFQSRSPSTKVEGNLYRPKGKGPFPAVMVLHTCGGVRSHEYDVASRLRERGYVALIVDSFSSRGVRNCNEGDTRQFFLDFVQDSLGALAYLSSVPFVDRSRIAVIGFSLGGGVAIELSDQSKTKGIGSIRAAVAFYPPRSACRAWTNASIPVLFFYGALDNWTPPGQCVDKASQLRQEKGQQIAWKIYPGAYHGFDIFREVRRVNSRGYITEYNPEAASDSWSQVFVFLDQNLR